MSNPSIAKHKNQQTVERLKIEGLHGTTTIEAQLEDGTLIIVGENGSGKTTFLRLAFYFLSGRWQYLSSFDFESIEATIGGQIFKVDRPSLRGDNGSLGDLDLGRLPRVLRLRIMELAARGDLTRASLELERFTGRNVTPKSVLRQIDMLGASPKSVPRAHLATIADLHKAVGAQILYLPTYRRIERELGSIFEGVDSDDFSRQRSRLRESENGEAFIELVEFGMKDVQAAVDRTLESIKEFARESLNSLTLGYLGDVVNRAYLREPGLNPDISEEMVRSVLDRIDERILTGAHKQHLFGVINSARSAKSPSEHERIVSHYFLKLLEFQRSLERKERQISQFCSLCSDYIHNKRFRYNSQTFEFSIEALGARRQVAISLGDLSSGEKQIVSLFSHLYLSGQKRFFVLIDEPELSLSVPWQRRFLVDIQSAAFCTGLVAVTHSPFIYDNKLIRYARSLDELTRPHGGGE